MKITADVLGLKELEKQLEKVAGATRGKVLRGALRKAAAPIKKDMQTSATSYFTAQSGQLSESIQIKTTLNKKGEHSIYDAAAYVGVYPNKKAQLIAGTALPAPVYAYWLETGVKPHILNPKGLNDLLHPGFAGRPFIRPALFVNQNIAVETTRRALAKGISQAIKRQAK